MIVHLKAASTKLRFDIPLFKLISVFKLFGLIYSDFYHFITQTIQKQEKCNNIIVCETTMNICSLYRYYYQPLLYYIQLDKYKHLKEYTLPYEYIMIYAYLGTNLQGS